MRSFLLVALLVAADQASKYAVRLTFDSAHSIPLIPHVLHLTYVQNTGMAFGLFRESLGWLIACSLGVSAWLVWELCRKTPPTPWPMRWGLVLVLSGALGNLIDRVWLGYVVDMIDLRVWPVFNLADSCITFGVVLLLWHAFQKVR